MPVEELAYEPSTTITPSSGGWGFQSWKENQVGVATIMDKQEQAIFLSYVVLVPILSNKEHLLGEVKSLGRQIPLLI